MKRILLLLIYTLSFSGFAQDGIQFRKESFSQLLAQAKKENKLVFIDAMAVWCGPCKMMDKNVFPQKSVGDFYNSHFINGKFDMEKGEGREIAKRYGVQSYPTFLFINGDGQLISQNMGYLPESTFLELGREAAAVNSKFGSMKERFEKGETDPEFLINIIKLHSSTDYDFARRASERYFKNKKNKEFTKDEVGYLLFFVKSVDDANYKIFQANREALNQHFTPQTFIDFDNQLQIQKLWENAVNTTTKAVNETQFLEKASILVGKENAQQILNRLKLNHYEQTGQFAEYERTALAHYQNPDAHESTELLKAAWVFLDKASTPTSFATALMWAEKTVMRSENPENTYILARLYQKTGKNAEALMYAETSARLAKQRETDATAAEQLIEELKKNQ